MPAAAIYTRVSTDEQARRGVSLEAQREACLAYCARSGLVVAAVIVDLEARQLRNLEAMQAGALTPDLLAQANRPLVEEHARLSEELAALEAGARTPGQWVKLGAGAGERLVARLRKADAEKQLAVLEQLVARVEVFPGRLVVRHPEDLLPPVELPLPRYYRPPKAR